MLFFFHVFQICAVAKVIKATRKYFFRVMYSFRNLIRNPLFLCLRKHALIYEFECYTFFQILASVQCNNDKK
jgi:hypothetical protein